MENVVGEQGLTLQQLFHSNLKFFQKKKSNCQKSHSLVPGASNLAVVMFSTGFFHSRYFKL